MGENLIEFTATPTRCVYNAENFKIYGATVDIFKFPNLKYNKYGGITIKGDFQELNLECEYQIKAEEVSDSKYGYTYVVKNIRSPRPTTIESSRKFLQEILTYNQAETLLSVYPDIIDRIINDRLSDIDLNKTKGIKEYTFNVIKRKVIENYKLAEIVDEFAGLFSFNVIKKLYDKYTSVEKIKEKLKNEPYDCLCSIGGIGFKTADEMLLKQDKNLLTSSQRMMSCAEFVLSENENNGNTYMTIKSFYNSCRALTKECISHLGECMKDNTRFYLDKANQRIAKINTYETEKYIADRLKEGLTINTKWNIDTEKYRLVNGSELTDEQMQTMKKVCENNVVILQGFGGTGKSFSTLGLINLLNDNHKTALLLAPTGRAAKVLKGYTNHEASTIHRGLGFKPPNNWGINSKMPLNCDIVILDEFSMTDIHLFRRLLEGINFNKTKLLLIGDEAQIPSVGCGNLLHDLLKSKSIPTVYLDKVFRYGKGGLSTVATDVRQGKMTFNDKDKVQVIGEDDGFTYISLPQEKSINYIIRLYKKLLSKVKNKDDVIIVTSQNVGNYGTEVINNKIQEEVNPVGKYIQHGKTKFKINDPVIQCTNNYKSIIYNDDEGKTTFISNGEIGVIKDILCNALVVDFDGTKIYIPKEQFAQIKLAYAISIHKCQGSQYKYIIAFTPKAHTFMLNSNLLYVAVTRAQEKCFLITDNNTYKRAIKIKENLNRNTFTVDLLTENNNQL